MSVKYFPAPRNCRKKIFSSPFALKNQRDEIFRLVDARSIDRTLSESTGGATRLSKAQSENIFHFRFFYYYSFFGEPFSVFTISDGAESNRPRQFSQQNFPLAIFSQQSLLPRVAEHFFRQLGKACYPFSRSFLNGTVLREWQWNKQKTNENPIHNAKVRFIWSACFVKGWITQVLNGEWDKKCWFKLWHVQYSNYGKCSKYELCIQVRVVACHAIY